MVSLAPNAQLWRVHESLARTASGVHAAFEAFPEPPASSAFSTGPPPPLPRGERFAPSSPRSSFAAATSDAANSASSEAEDANSGGTPSTRTS